MQTLSSELKQLIGRRLEVASSQEILAIASSLCVEAAPAVASVPANVEFFGTSTFEIIDEKMVRDRRTGLVWLRDYVPGGKRNWKESIEAAENFTFGGFKWRAPTIREQLSIIDYGRHHPAYDASVFNGEDGWMWTSTVYSESPGDYAWGVSGYFGNAYIYNRSYKGFVRAVRVSQ
jgi:hypothetical protein